MSEKFDKLLIVGFDGLDRKKIEHYNCKNIMLESFGKLDLEGIPLKTPILWSSLITGVMPEVHGNRKMLEFRGEKPKKADRYIEKFFDLFGMNALQLRKCLMYYIFDSSLVPPNRENLEVETLFDSIASSKIFDMPGYSDYPYISGKMNVGPLHRKYPPAGKSRVVRDVEAEHMYRKNQLFENIGKHDVMIQHLHYPDWMQHLYHQGEKDKQIYNEMDELAGKILEKAGEDTLVVFCSDHGLEGGGHRDEAFYAANTELEEPVKITNLVSKCLEKVDYEKTEEAVTKLEV